jgi:hypothetical protein
MFKRVPATVTQTLSLFFGSYYLASVQDSLQKSDGFFLTKARMRSFPRTWSFLRPFFQRTRIISELAYVLFSMPGKAERHNFV